MEENPYEPPRAADDQAPPTNTPLFIARALRVVATTSLGVIIGFSLGFAMDGRPFRNEYHFLRAVGCAVLGGLVSCAFELHRVLQPPQETANPTFARTVGRATRRLLSFIMSFRSTKQ